MENEIQHYYDNICVGISSACNSSHVYKWNRLRYDIENVLHTVRVPLLSQSWLYHKSKIYLPRFSAKILRRSAESFLSLQPLPFLINLFCSMIPLPASFHFSSIQSLPQKTRILTFHIYVGICRQARTHFRKM